MSRRYRGTVLWAVLIASGIPGLSVAASITVVNQSSLVVLPNDPFTASIQRRGDGLELVVTGTASERTSAGERLTYAVLEIVVLQADGSVLWPAESLRLPPNNHLDWRVVVKPFGQLDGDLIDKIILRDRDVWTAERREKESRQRAEAEREQAKAERQAAVRRERQREAAIRARGWPKNIEHAVIERTVVMGMTSEQVSMAWGRPNQVNETVRVSGVSEQWVYSVYRYVYFENGRVTAIQSSR
jgi:hypothetical protein